VIYAVWLSGILIGVILFALFVLLLGSGPDAQSQGKRNIQTALENQGSEVAPVQLSSAGCTSTTPCKVALLDKMETDMKSSDPKVAATATQQYKETLARGQANFARICIGCHYGPPDTTSNGPWLGNLYQTGSLFNGKPINDANVVTFILLGSQAHNLQPDNTSIYLGSKQPDGSIVSRSGGWNPMPSGIATPLQAVDITAYLKQQTSKK
jgi:hypothetical protein